MQNKILEALACFIPIIAKIFYFIKKQTFSNEAVKKVIISLEAPACFFQIIAKVFFSFIKEQKIFSYEAVKKTIISLK
jgi:hypothetical protein